MMKSVLKALIICLLAIPFFWFGLKYGQPPKPAYGEIFRELSHPLFLRYRYLQSEQPGSGWRFSRINNNPVYYRVEKAHGGVHGLFDSLERAMSSGQGIAQKAGYPAGVADAQNRAKGLGPVPIFRLEWEDWGVLGFVLPDELAGHEELAVPAAKSSGLAGQAQSLSTSALMAVLGFFNREEGATTYLTFWFDGSFDFSQVLETSESDSPGQDAPGMPRYPGLKRKYTFEEAGEEFASVIVVYTGRGAFHEVANFYRARMMGLGWELKESAGNLGRGSKSEDVLVFTRRGKECVIHTGLSGPGLVQVIVSVRESTTKG